MVCELQRRECVQSQIGPALQEVGQVHESVQAQSIVPIVRQMSHEDTDLQNRRQSVSTDLAFLYTVYLQLDSKVEVF